MRVSPGEVLALTGPSGSGKSTLLHCLSGILAPDSGRVLYDGRELTTLTDRERSALRRREFGFVFQFGQLVPELTCQENVELPLRLSGVRRARARGPAAELLARLGVSEVAGKRPGQVSGGQGQRVAVARALVTGPRVIFADEPTGALDSRNGEQVMGLLVAAARERGSAVVLVTHETRIAAFADREAVFRDGAAVERQGAR
ncbi:ABC transporter ATP-binding protein [Winogradskya humida]|uniref:ABC transporter ATP-binding protein n=1 Tax=Winogradskya humida TaxID=113566 RepID=A0ABQ4A780_9ACTN|nr:ABC transporter ATP-binding protein [Actinoplanes humidus]